MINRLCISSIIFFSLLTSLYSADWPNFRGPNFDGISIEKGLKLNFSANRPKVIWKAKVNVGFSSITTSAGRVYTMGHRSGQDYVFCLDERSGKVIWSKKYSAELQPNLYEGGPNSTPTVHDGLVYTLGKHGQFYCLDARTGREKWSANLSKDFSYPAPEWGFSGSPYITGDLVILNAGRSGIAFNRKSGKVVWKSARGDASYSTPVPYGKSILLFAADGISSLSPMTGKKNWSYPWKTSYKINSADPIIKGTMLFISSGYGRGASTLELTGSGPKKVWENKGMRNHFSSSVYHNGYVYGIDGNTNDGGAGLKCISFKTGKVEWEEEIGFGSLIMAGDSLLVLRSKGQLLSVKATPKSYVSQGKVQILGGKCWTSPIVSNGKILARNAKGDLVCLNLK